MLEPLNYWKKHSILSLNLIDKLNPENLFYLDKGHLRSLLVFKTHLLNSVESNKKHTYIYRNISD